MSVISARRTPVELLADLGAYRQLVVNLTIRDLRLKYKGSALGVLWSLLNPLIMMVIYTAVFSVFLRVITVPNYWALVLGGLLAWVFFSSALSSATVSFIRNGNLITKVAFPIEALPLSNVFAHFLNLLIMLAVLLVVVAVRGIPIGPSLVLLPVIVIALLAFTVGLGIFLAALTVYFRDFEHLVALGLTAWFYVSPVLYPLDPAALPASARHYVWLLKLNPLSWYLEPLHSVLFFGRWPDPTLFGLMLASAIAVPIAGYLFFAWLRPRIPEEV
ncbi:MAG TPA: ABC transporter permease [Candidatus Dormibacteraeota bacterium]